MCTLQLLITTHYLQISWHEILNSHWYTFWKMKLITDFITLIMWLFLKIYWFWIVNCALFFYQIYSIQMLVSFIAGGGKFGILVRCAAHCLKVFLRKRWLHSCCLLMPFYQEGYPQCKFQADTLLCETCK